MPLNSPAAKYIIAVAVVRDNFHVERLGVYRSLPLWQKWLILWNSKQRYKLHSRRIRISQAVKHKWSCAAPPITWRKNTIPQGSCCKMKGKFSSKKWCENINSPGGLRIEGYMKSSSFFQFVSSLSNSTVANCLQIFPLFFPVKFTALLGGFSWWQNALIAMSLIAWQNSFGNLSCNGSERTSLAFSRTF